MCFLWSTNWTFISQKMAFFICILHPRKSENFRSDPFLFCLCIWTLYGYNRLMHYPLRLSDFVSYSAQSSVKGGLSCSEVGPRSNMDCKSALLLFHLVVWRLQRSILQSVDCTLRLKVITYKWWRVMKGFNTELPLCWLNDRYIEREPLPVSYSNVEKSALKKEE
jgi:hypothetical protein